MRFVLLNQSTTTDPALGGELTDDVGQHMAAVLEVYLDRDVASEWGGDHVVAYAKDVSQLAGGDVVMAIIDTPPADVSPGTVAYHSADGKSLPFGFVFRSMCNSLLEGVDSVAGAAAHECAETAADPFANFLATDAQGHGAWLELCDPTEGDGYVIDGVTVPNIVLRSYFAPGADGPYELLGERDGNRRIAAPFTPNASGYQGYSAASGAAELLGRMKVAAFASVSGRRAVDVAWIEGNFRAGRLEKKAHWSSRTFRRGLRLAVGG
jgi:hypothetical protein